VTDLLANAERPPDERPRPIAPLLPDLVPDERPWLGPAGAEAARWRERALRAETHVLRLEQALARHRFRP
jgi:hypothetical protein